VVKLSRERQAEIEALRSRVKSGGKISADELKKYSSEDMMKGRFNRNQEIVNQQPLIEREILKLKRMGDLATADEAALLMKDVSAKNPNLKPNNNSFYDLKGNPNIENQAVARSMETMGTSKPGISASRRMWNLGEYNNNIPGQGGNSMVPMLAGAAGTMLLGELVSRTPDLQLTVHGAGEGSDVLPDQKEKDIYNEIRKNLMMKGINK
jgi:hypothetical protein